MFLNYVIIFITDCRYKEWHSNKRRQILLFYKSRRVKCYHTKQHQTVYRKIKCDFLNFRVIQNGYHQDFQYLRVYSFFFIKWQRECNVLCLMYFNHEKSFFFRFFWWEDISIPRGVKKINHSKTLSSYLPIESRR